MCSAHPKPLRGNSWVWKNDHTKATTKSVTFSQLLRTSERKNIHFSLTNMSTEAYLRSLIRTKLSFSPAPFSHSLAFLYINLIWNCKQIPQQHLQVLFHDAVRQKSRRADKIKSFAVKGMDKSLSAAQRYIYSSETLNIYYLKCKQMC